MKISKLQHVRNSRGNGFPMSKHVITRGNPAKSKEKNANFSCISRGKLGTGTDLCSRRHACALCRIASTCGQFSIFGKSAGIGQKTS